MSNSCFSRVFTPRKSFTQKSKKNLKNAKKFRLGAESNFRHETSSQTSSLCATQPDVIETIKFIYIVDRFLPIRIFFLLQNLCNFFRATIDAGARVRKFLTCNLGMNNRFVRISKKSASDSSERSLVGGQKTNFSGLARITWRPKEKLFLMLGIV